MPAYHADTVYKRVRGYLSGVFNTTPAASIAGSTTAEPAVVRGEDVLSHASLRDRMFCI